MSDQNVQPCLQEADGFPQMYNDIEQVRSSVEELCWHERQASIRHKAMRSMPNDYRLHEQSDLAGLYAHDAPPRLLVDHDFRENDSFGKSLKHVHRRKEMGTNGAIMPFSMLVARPVSRDEFVKNTKAMAAYWLEWENLEKKNVWRWETLTEWDDVAAEARQADKEIHFGYFFGTKGEQ